MDNKEYEKMKSEAKLALWDINPIIIVEDDNGDEQVVLTKRVADASAEGGKWCLPGAKVLDGETIEEALKRIAKIKTGLDIIVCDGDVKFALCGVFDNPERDKREHVVGFTFFCELNGEYGKGRNIPKAGGNAEKVELFYFDEAVKLDLAFDHKEILEDLY